MKEIARENGLSPRKNSHETQKTYDSQGNEYSKHDGVNFQPRLIKLEVRSLDEMPSNNLDPDSLQFRSPQDESQRFYEPCEPTKEQQESKKPTPEPTPQLSKRTRPAIKYNNSPSESESESPRNVSCTCEKTGCLKLYCLCFHMNRECSDKCKCSVCFNNFQHQEKREAAIEKVKRKAQRTQHDDDLFDLNSIWGCNCKKSKCQKKYCECFNRNQRCSAQCRCISCENKKKRRNSECKMKKKFQTSIEKHQ